MATSKRKSNGTTSLKESSSPLSILSIVLSVAALFFAGLTWYEARQTRIAPVLDVFELKFDGPADRYPVRLIGPRTELTRPQLSKFISVPFEGTVSNTGISTISITYIGISEKGPGRNERWYPQIPQGFFDARTAEPLTLPLILEAGKSQSFVAYVGMVASEKAYNFLGSVGGTMKLYDFMFALAGQKVDIYDNPVKPTLLDGTVIQFEYLTMKASQIFNVTMSTARGSKAETEISWHSAGPLRAAAAAPEVN